MTVPGPTEGMGGWLVAPTWENGGVTSLPNPLGTETA